MGYKNWRGNSIIGLHKNQHAWKSTISEEYILGWDDTNSVWKYKSGTLTKILADRDWVENNVLDTLDWQESVINEIDFTAAEPGAPTNGDRYINTTTGAGSATGVTFTAKCIYQYESANLIWREITPNEGTVCENETTNRQRYFNNNVLASGSWVNYGTILLDFTVGTFTPATNVDAINIIGTNLTTASALDLDFVVRTGASATALIDVNLGTSIITADETVIHFTDSRNHDDVAADTIKGYSYDWSGNLPGTNATTYLTLHELVYSGVLGAAGANGVIRGLYIDGTGYTHTNGIFYGALIDVTGATVVAGTQYGLGIITDATTTNAIFIDSATTDRTVNGDVISVDLDIAGAGLTTGVTMFNAIIDGAISGLLAGDYIKGINLDINEGIAHADTSYITGYDITMTGLVNSGADLYAYRAIFDGTKDDGDTSIGFWLAANQVMNNVGEIFRGVQLDLNGIWATSIDEITGIYIQAAVNDRNNPIEGILISKSLDSSAGATSQTNSALNIISTNINTHASIMDVSNDLVSITESNTASAAGADTYAGNLLALAYAVTTDTTGTATNSATCFNIDYDITETAGILTLASFDVVNIDFDSVGTPEYGAGDYNLLHITGNDANIPTYAATGMFSGINIDLKGMDVSDAQLVLSGLYIEMPTAAGSTVAHINSDSSIITNMPVPIIGADIGVAGSPAYWVPLGKKGISGMTVTEFYIDLTGLSSVADDGDVIGDTGQTTSATLGQYTTAIMGTIATGGAIEMVCLEVPQGGTADIDLYSIASGTLSIDDDASGGTQLITAGGNWINGMVKGATADPTATHYFYLTAGAAAAGDYTHGKFIIRIYGA